MKKNIYGGILIIVFITVFFIFYAQDTPQNINIKQVSLATHKIPLSAPFIIAKEKGFFDKNGLDMKVTYFLTGPETIQALIAGQVDFGSTGVTPFVHFSFQRDDIKIISQITLANDFQIIARKDAGITTPADIKGKKIGSVKGTITLIAIRDTLKEAGLAEDEYSLIEFNQPLSLPNLLFTKEIDAYSSWEPHISNGVKIIGEDNIVIFGAEEGLHPLPYFAMMRKSDLENELKIDMIDNFNRAISEAIEYIRDNRKESIKVVAKIVGMDEFLLDSVWNKYDFSLVLGNELLNELNAERDWFGKPEAQSINYLNFIDTSSLKRIDPKRVEF